MEILEKIHRQAGYCETLRQLDNARIAKMLENLADNLQPLSEEVALLQEASGRLRQFLEMAKGGWYCQKCKQVHSIAKKPARTASNVSSQLE